MKQQTLWFFVVFLAPGGAFTAPYLVSRFFISRRRHDNDNDDFGCLLALDQDDGQNREGLMTQPNTSTRCMDSVTTTEERPSCYYKSPSSAGRWKPRIELAELSIGQELPDAVVVQELLEGKTGPKVFVDCGVGRYIGPQKGWKIQTAMLRLNERKQSVAAKRVARLRRKECFPVYVSRIRLDNDQLEVCLNPEDVAQYQQQEKQISVSNLKQGQECVGTVERVLDYGVLVNVGANRHGLLHIQRVADLNGHFINKAAGLMEAGLERGARIKVQVLEPVQKKRLFLDFTEDVKQSAKEELEKQAEQRQKEQQRKETVGSDTKDTQGAAVASLSSSDPYAAYAQEAAAWAAYKEQNQTVAGEGDYDDAGVYDDDDDDDYDEDRDIEDALGLGTY